MDEFEQLIYDLQDEYTRRNALGKLDTLGDARATVPIINTIGEDIDPNPRFVVLARNALINIGRNAVQPLIASLFHDNNILRELAADVLAEIGDTQAVQPLIKVMLEDTDEAVAQAATEALGKIGGDEAIESLVVATNHTNPYVRLTAIEALGEISDRKVIQPLRALLDSEDEKIKNAAKNSLAKMNLRVEIDRELNSPASNSTIRKQGALSPLSETWFR
ncbi:MAG: HEAT repeat domain-containing protein [Anaerolineae bacterium]|nr:HEAT repeat domain-containing protein [Anaerolineae bacterium]